MQARWRLLSVIALLVPVLLLTVNGIAQQQPRFTTDSEEQYQALAAAMKQNSYPISLHEGKLRGAGMEFLARKTASAQFVVFGEEHGVKEFPEFLAALFGFLHQQSNFNYLALESDPVSAHVVSLAPLRGDTRAIVGYARRYPNAFTFPTAEELGMISEIGRISTGRADATWGLDQSFGVLHALDRLQALPGFHTTAVFQALAKEAGQRDSTRLQNSETHYMANVKLADLEELRQQIAAKEGSEARFIVDNLVSSSEIYGYYHRAGTGELTGYLNGFEREEQMKHLFMREYRAAQAAGETNPKVLAKLGHWHVFRGLGPSHLQTLGNFLTEFATANGTEAFTIGVYLRGSWRDVTNQRGLAPIAVAADPTGWTIIDFRALRPRVHAGQFGTLAPNMIAAIYGFDAALVLGGASAGTSVFGEEKTRSSR